MKNLGVVSVERFPGIASNRKIDIGNFNCEFARTCLRNVTCNGRWSPTSENNGDHMSH
jgi:hypothetical protein